MTRTETIQQEALQRARSSRSMANHLAVIEGFASRGIPESEIEPTVNVLTYHAWRAVGRQVRRGEKAVRIPTWVPITREVEDPETGETVRQQTGRRPKAAYVFHISQTDSIEAR